MNEPRRSESWIWILGAAVLCVVLSPEPLLLDEETHLYIANHTSILKPYDWVMPFPPFHETGFVFAHPPLFHWWVKLVGDSILTAVPWLLLWWSGVWRLARHCRVSPRLSMLILMASAGVLLPLTRSVMPDLMVSALGVTALSLYLSTTKTAKVIASGVCLGLAMWTKYPAVLLLFIPMIVETDSRKVYTFVGTALGVFGVGELWIYIHYEQWHLLTVIVEADIVGRSPLGSRVFGLPVRLGLAALPIALVGVKRHPFYPLGVLGVGVYYLDLSLGLCLALGLSALGLFWKAERWMGVWAGLVLLGVVVGHNYVSPRYWLLAMPPLAILASKQMMDWKGWHLGLLFSFSAVWTAGILHTERLHADTSAALSQQALSELPAEVSIDDMAFSGEWTFRSEMLKAGVQPFDDQQQVVLTAVNSAGWTPPSDSNWVLLKTWEGGNGHFRLSSSEDSIGWYADTLGVYPIQVSTVGKPIERVELWKRQ